MQIARSISIAALQFADSDQILDIQPCGNGLINDTYLVACASRRFILQRINGNVFPNPRQIMENLRRLQLHVSRKPVGEATLQLPKILYTRHKQLGHRDQNGAYWRALTFIENTCSKEVITSTTDAEQVGYALGHFHRLCSDLNPESLYDTLPGFHITTEYLNQYQKTLQNVQIPVAGQQCAAFIHSRLHLAPILEQAKLQGHLSLRVIHGDPKLNNILFDQTGEIAVSIIDLDTVKPGLLHYDIGDCIRSCCNSNSEDDTEAHFDVALCTSLLKSYLAETADFFSIADYAHLYAAIRLIPYELGVRFFTDYLQGNPYFKVSEAEQNLHRANNQLQLMACIEQQQSAIEEMINNFRKKLENHNRALQRFS